MYYDFIQRHKKRVIFAGIAFVLLLITWAVVVAVSHIGKLPVVVAVVPSDAMITADGKRIGGGTQWLVPGTYSIKASKDGFATLEKTLVVSSVKSQNVIALSLTAQSDEAKKWAAEHQSDYTKNEQYGSIAASEDGKYFTAQHPITAKLPFVDPYFTLSYVRNDDNSITLTIATPSPRYRFYAVEEIRKLGYDPTDFTIQFKDFVNPLGQK